MMTRHMIAIRFGRVITQAVISKAVVAVSAIAVSVIAVSVIALARITLAGITLAVIALARITLGRITLGGITLAGMAPAAIAVAVITLAAIGAPAGAAPSSGDIGGGLPPVLKDSTKAATCTVTYLVTNIVTNDTIAVRMQVTPDQNDSPVGNLMPCPPDIPPRVASRALDACIARAGDPKDCVFADMARDFEKHPSINSTAENASRCSSDKASDIGIACFLVDGLQVCSVGCGGSPQSAIASAIRRCGEKQQQQCPIAGSQPVLAPR
jgi:hypothetical protein